MSRHVEMHVLDPASSVKSASCVELDAGLRNRLSRFGSARGLRRTVIRRAGSRRDEPGGFVTEPRLGRLEREREKMDEPTRLAIEPGSAWVTVNSGRSQS